MSSPNNAYTLDVVPVQKALDQKNLNNEGQVLDWGYFADLIIEKQKEQIYDLNHSAHPEIIKIKDANGLSVMNDTAYNCIFFFILKPIADEVGDNMSLYQSKDCPEAYWVWERIRNIRNRVTPQKTAVFLAWLWRDHEEFAAKFYEDIGLFPRPYQHPLKEGRDTDRSEAKFEAIARRLIADGADVDERDEKGWTPLMTVSQVGRESMVRFLIENGADINARSDADWTALMAACFEGHQSVARLLLKEGAEIEARADEGSTPLMLASVNGHKDVALLLIERKADVNAHNDKDVTALILASYNGHRGVAQLLIEAGAEMEASSGDGATALMAACHEGHKAVAQLLISAGANVNARDKSGVSVLDCARSNGYREIEKILLEAGAKD